MDGTGQLFYRQVPALSRRFTVVTYALRDDAHDMDTLVRDLVRVLDTVAPNREPAVLVAESFGGTLAMTTALAHAERIRALVLLNTFPYFRPQFRLHLAMLGIRVIPWGAMRMVRRLTAFRLHSHHTHRDDVKRFLKLTALTTRRGYLSRLRILTRYDVRHRLHELGMPTLLLAADEDHLIPSVQQAEVMARGIPNVTTVVLRGHGHSCFLAGSLDLDAMLAEWLPAMAG
jgi:pimeloyl-ACP methyl ester carboxylesterase